MINDDQSFDSSGNASFDTSAAMRPGSVHELHEEKLFGGDLSSRRSSSNHVLPIDSMNEVFSLEMARQEEIKRQAIINALNQFIVQAGNIYKGNKLSTTDKNKLHDAATHAGLSVKVVDALLKQTAAQNAAVEYCFNSDDVIVRRIKEDPQLSESILEKGKNNLLEGRVDGLNVSSSVWRIFLHKIIKQFLKEQNMELGDIMEKSSQTRKVYEDALRCDPSENNIFDVSKRPRDYSEERKHVFISQADAKLARLEASEAMVKFQQCKNVSVYDLVDGTSIQRHRGLPPVMPKTEVYFHDSRDDDLSMVACAPKRESSFNNWKETNTTENKKLNDTLSIIPVLEEGSTSSPEKIGAIQQEDDILTTTTFSTLIHKGTPPSQITIESRDDEKNAHNTTPKEMKRDCQSPPTSVASPKENNYSRTSLYSSESKVLWSPIADKERAVPNSTPGRSKVSDAVIQKIAVFESNFDSTKAKSDSSKIRKRQSLQNVNVFQARAIFDADSSQSKQSPQIKQVPNQKALPSGNVSQARAIFDADSSQSKHSPQTKQVPNQKALPSGNVSEVQAIFDADSSQSTQSPQTKQVPNQKTLLYANVSEVQAIFDADSSQLKAKSPQIQEVQAIFDADSSQSKQSPQIKEVPNRSTLSSVTVSKVQEMLATDSSQLKQKSTQNDQVSDRSALRSGNVPEVRELFSVDSSQPNLYSSKQKKAAKNQNVLSSDKVSQARAVFEKKDEQIAVGPEPIRKGQNAKIQDVLATLTQKGQCDNMLSSEHETEIKRFKASGMEDRKQNRVKESPRATRDQENVTDEDCKGCTKRRAPQCDHSVLEDKTSSFQNKSYAEETVRIQRAQFGTEQSRLGNAEDPEFKFQPNSAIKSTSVDFDEVVTNNDFCDSNHSGNDVEDVCQARAPDCTPLILPHSLELSSTDESVGAHHPPIFTENFKLASDTSNRLSDGPDEDVRDNSRKLHFHAQYTKKETPKEQIISSLVHYSDIPRDQNCESVSFLTFEDTRSDKSFKRSSFGDFLKPDTIEVVEDLVMGAHNQLHTSLAYINSESDDSDEVPIPPPTKPRKVEPCQVETTSTTKKDQKVTLCTDDVIDLSELSDQNAWAAFDSNITFHEETRIHSHFKDNTFDHNRTKSKKVENSSPKRVEFREISNTSMKTKFKSWANFESNEIVRTQYRESVIQNENKKEIKNLEVGDTMTPKRVQPTRKSNVDRECDSPEDNGPMEKKERRKTPKEKRNVQNHACSTLENDINKDLPNAFLSDFAALAIPNQEIVLERPFGGDSSESRKNKDLPSNPSALGTSSNYKKDFKSGQKKGIPQNKIRNEECTNIDVKSQEIVKTGVRGHAPELIQEKELMGSQANAYFESLLLNKSSSSCVHEDKIFKNVSSQEAHQSSSDDEAYFENLLLKKTSSPFFDDDSCYRNFRSENAPNGEKFYPRAETSNKQECKEHSFEAAEISLSIDHQPLSNRQTRKEMSSLRESYGHISWEQFASNFSHNADVEDSPLRESNAHQKVNNNLSNVKDKNKLELNQSPLTSNKDTDKREETTNSSDWHNGNSQDFLLMKEFSSAGQVGGIAFVETNNRCVPHVGERVLPENQLERKNRVSGKFHDEDIVARDELETKFSNLNLHSISSIRNPANIASEERKGSNIYRRDERASADDKGRFHYAQGLSSESDVIELSSEKDNCIKLEDSNSIRDHRQGIRDFLENRGNLRGEHFGRSQHRSEFTQVVEVQQDNKPSGGSDPLDSQNTIQHQEIRNFSKQQKRDSLQHHLEQSQHLNKQSQAENLDWEEALSEKLDQYEAIHANRHQESIDFQHMEDLSDRESAQPQDLNEVPRRDSIERKDSPSELHDHFEALNAYLAEYERGGKQPKDSSERNNGMGHSCQTTHTTDQHNHFEDILGDYNRDQESKKSTSVLSDTHLVETVTIENGEAGNRYSHDVSWPTNTEDSRRVPENQIGRDMGDEALNDFVMPSGNDYAHSNLYNNDSEEGVDTTTYNHSNGVLDSTGHLQHQDQNQYIHDRRHVVRILDRSLLDLDEDGDEDECLDAIEVERQNTYSSNDRDPDADTPCASNRMDPPDPLPAHRYPEGRRLSTPIPTPNDLAEAPEGATKEEIDLLNRFIDVASSDFGGQILAPESEARVRSAALKVGLTPKFVDQLLNTTMKPSENHEKNLAFVAPPELQEQQPSLYDGKNNYHNNDYSYSHQFDGDYGGDNETYNTADYSRSYAKQSRRSGYEDGNCNTNIWEFLGQNLVHLANVTAKTCGVNYHRNDRRNNRRYRDDGDSIVSAISWDGDHARSSSTSRRDRSRRRSREADDWEAADLVPEENSDCRQKEERTRHVTFEDHVDEQSYNPVVRNESPPREKITQLV